MRRFATYPMRCVRESLVLGVLHATDLTIYRSADESSMKQAIVDALREFHHIDGLVLNAGTLDPIARIGDTSMPASAWKAHFDVNFFSLISTIQDVLPALRRSELGGRVIFISSGAATKGTAAWGPYNASKAAMNSLCRYVETCLISISTHVLHQHARGRGTWRRFCCIKAWCR